MKIDKHLKGLSDRLNAYAFSHSKLEFELNPNSNETTKDDDNDDYYLSRGLEPPRFRYYRHVRAEKWKALVKAGQHKPSDYDDSITQDELDYVLKRQLRIAPEERYQQQRKNRFFHDLGSYMRGLSIDDYDKGCHDQQCIPECRFYPEYGRIEDQEVIEEHNKRVEYLKQKDAIVEPPSEDDRQKANY